MTEQGEVHEALMYRTHGMLRPVQLQSPGQHESSCDNHRIMGTILPHANFQTGWANSQNTFCALHKDQIMDQETSLFRSIRL